MEVRGEGTAVKVIAAFTKESIAETKEKYGLKTGDVVFLENPSGGGTATAQILVEAGIRAVIIPEDISHAAEETFFKGDVPVLKDILLERAEDFAMAEPETLKLQLQPGKKKPMQNATKPNRTNCRVSLMNTGVKDAGAWYKKVLFKFHGLSISHLQNISLFRDGLGRLLGKHLFFKQ